MTFCISGEFFFSHLGNIYFTFVPFNFALNKLGLRPARTVYSITDKGISAFKNMTKGLLEFEYMPTFSSDAVFYFSDHIETEDIIVHLSAYIDKLNHTISHLKDHKKETMNFVPPEYRTMVSIIFSHHEHHFRAELEWAEETLNRLK